MTGAGFDPYRYVTEAEDREHEWLMRRPFCDVCGDRIRGNVYEVAGRTLCEDCLASAIHVVQKGLVDLVAEKYGKHADGSVIINAVQTMVDEYDFGEYMSDAEVEP